MSDETTAHLNALELAYNRRKANHPGQKLCFDDDPCPHCAPLVDTINYNRARLPRRILLIIDTVAFVTEVVCFLLETVRLKRR